MISIAKWGSHCQRTARVKCMPRAGPLVSTWEFTWRQLIKARKNGYISIYLYIMEPPNLVSRSLDQMTSSNPDLTRRRICLPRCPFYTGYQNISIITSLLSLKTIYLVLKRFTNEKSVATTWKWVMGEVSEFPTRLSACLHQTQSREQSQISTDHKYNDWSALSDINTAMPPSAANRHFASFSLKKRLSSRTGKLNL